MRLAKLFVLAAASLTLSLNINAQTAEEVVANHVKAIGGADNWKKIKTMVMEASVSAGGMEIPVIITRVHNKGVKQEFTVMNMTGYTIITDQGGWNFNPMQGQTKAEPMTADELKVGQDGLDLQGEVIDYAAKGHKIELQGKEDVDGTECYKLKLTRKSGRETYMFIDPKTWYCIQESGKITVNGQEIQQTTKLSNFTQQPEGVVIALTMESAAAPAPITITKVKINGDVPDSVFKPAQ
jgi:outer membrane lipoprotein-sorting protein